MNFPTTDFSRFEHEQLIAMLEGNTPGAVLGGADDLEKVARRIDVACEAIRDRLRHLNWQGESADEFRHWADHVTSAAEQLAAFVQEASTQLRAAGGQLASTKLPPVNPADVLLASSPIEHERQAGTRGLEAAKAEAVRQMQALGSTYRVVAERLAGLEEPRFPQAPNVVGVDVQRLGSVGSAGYSPVSGSNFSSHSTPLSRYTSLFPAQQMNEHLQPLTSEPSPASTFPFTAPAHHSTLTSAEPSIITSSTPLPDWEPTDSHTTRLTTPAAQIGTMLQLPGGPSVSAKTASRPAIIGPAQPTTPPRVIQSGLRSGGVTPARVAPADPAGGRTPHPFLPGLPATGTPAATGRARSRITTGDEDAETWLSPQTTVPPVIR